MDINSTVLIGRLTRDPERFNTQGGATIASFSVAVGRKFKEKEETAFIDCKAFGHTANFIGDYCTKGDMIGVQGRIAQETWEDKATGQKRSRLIVIAENVQGLTRKSEPQAQPQTQAPAEPPPFDTEPIDDVPF